MTETETCVCAPQWIASGAGCMCWPTPTARRETEPETDQPEES